MHLKFQISNFRLPATEQEKTRVLSSIFHFPISIFYLAWWWLRQVSGDCAYENYLAWARRNGLNAPCSRGEFYVESLRRRYSGVSRCC